MKRKHRLDNNEIEIIGIGPSGQEAVAFMAEWGLDHPALKAHALEAGADVPPGLTGDAGLALIVGDFGAPEELAQAKAVAARGRKDGALVVALATTRRAKT